MSQRECKHGQCGNLTESADQRCRHHRRGWVSCADELPPIGRWVLCHHTRGTWGCIHDQEGVNHKVLQRREHTPGYVREPGWRWEEFGPDSFEPGTVDRWMEIPR